MNDQSNGISWTDFSSNVIRVEVLIDGNWKKLGWFCTKVSPGCQHCYSETRNLRYGNQLTYAEKNLPLIRFVINEKELKEWEKQPKDRKKNKVFVEDMSDLFHPEIPPTSQWVVLDAMERNRQWTFQLLTKRPDIMRERLIWRFTYVPDNIWVGTSVEMALYKDRIDILRSIPAQRHFLSIEPLLGPLGKLDLTNIQWVICGGESGSNFRPMNLDWAREVRDQCIEQGVAFWYKQGSQLRPGTNAALDGKEWHQFP